MKSVMMIYIKFISCTHALSPNVASKINYYPVPGSTGRIVQLILQNRTRIQAVHVCILYMLFEGWGVLVQICVIFQGG